MIDTLYLALRYISFYRIKTIILVGSITLISFLPFALEVLLDESERQLLFRAESTPLVLGAKGSALDLVMNTLYFDDEVPELISMKDSHEVLDSKLANPLSVYIRFHSRGFPIIGTTLDYFDFRDLEISQGHGLTLLGDCVIGHAVAENLNLNVGDFLISSPENIFDLAGVYPLKMKIVGILEKSQSADDRGVFVDLKTTWVIQGLGHGHDDLKTIKDQSVILGQNPKNIKANAKLLKFNEINEKNLSSFHFHGDLTDYPLTAVIALPLDHKSETILRGRYLSKNIGIQILRPKEVIDGLMQTIFRIKKLINSTILVVGLATLMAIILVFALSLRLRKKEIETIFKLGCSRLTIAKLLTAEIVLIILISTGLCLGLGLLLKPFSPELVRILLLS